MSKSGTEGVDMEAGIDDSHKDQIKDDRQTQQLEPVEKNEDHPMPSPNLQVELLKKKYGGLLPKKPPLISKDHEHAFFDSADWALGKQGGQKIKGPLEALRPKLEPTRHHNARSWRSTFAPAHDDDKILQVSMTILLALHLKVMFPLQTTMTRMQLRVVSARIVIPSLESCKH